MMVDSDYDDDGDTDNDDVSNDTNDDNEGYYGNHTSEVDKDVSIDEGDDCGVDAYCCNDKNEYGGDDELDRLW